MPYTAREPPTPDPSQTLRLQIWVLRCGLTALAPTAILLSQTEAAYAMAYAEELI